MMRKSFNFCREYNESVHVNGTFKERIVMDVAGGILYCIFKRIFDIFFSVFCLILCFCPIVLVAIIIKCSSKGPAFYKQERLGLNGKRFFLYKFRTMVIDAEKDGAQWALKNDPRITKIGNILRLTRFDELPQLINIFRGDMSFVGPRPERDFFYREFNKYIDGFDQRLKVIPGLTGFAQVNGGYDLKPEEKILYDLFYIENRNTIFDLKLIIQTVLVVFSYRGAR